MAGAVRFGVFDWIDLNPRLGSPADTYDQRLQVIEHLDRTGYWAYHVAEHHGTPLGSAPSPSLFLSSAVQRTRTLRLGPMVFLLPLYHPVRLVEEICMLDQLSRGRIELGVGRGASPYELAQFGIDANESRAMFEKAFRLVIEGLSTGHLSSTEGDFVRLSSADLILRPYQQPYPPLWYPTENPDRVAWVGEHGINLLMRRMPEGASAAEFAATYRRQLAAHRDRPGRLNRHVVEPAVGVVRHIFVADSDEEALRAAREAWKIFTESHSYLRLQRGLPIAAQADFDAQLAEQIVLVGSPSTVRKGVRDVIRTSTCNYFASCFSWGNLSTEQMLRSIELFTREVRPFVASEFAVAAC
jgi:alkanesulfonate monooxygenase SsuD/methylene tetrahydromethanopterin reductase-like flavin-dependent oxidoreductase (luciferase family)